MAGRGDRPLYRIELRHVGADPRIALRQSVPDDREVAEITSQLDAIDARSRRGPWTKPTLDLIAQQPAMVARDLAAKPCRWLMMTGEFAARRPAASW